jgi:hypothetical protein
MPHRVLPAYRWSLPGPSLRPCSSRDDIRQAINDEPLDGPKLQRYLGSAEWVLDRATKLRFHDRATDDDLIYLKDVKDLLALDLSETQITDAGLVDLNEPNGLQELGLSGTRASGGWGRDDASVDFFDHSPKAELRSA